MRNEIYSEKLRLRLFFLLIKTVNGKSDVDDGLLVREYR